MMHEPQSDIQKLKWLLVTSVVFIIALVMSWSELRFRVAGENVQADLLSTEVVRTRDQDGRSFQKLEYTYRFTEPDGTRREEADRAWEDVRPRLRSRGDDDDLEKYDTILVRYIPGSEGRSRIYGNHTLVWVWVLLGDLILLTVALVRFMAEYYRFRKRRFTS